MDLVDSLRKAKDSTERMKMNSDRMVQIEESKLDAMRSILKEVMVIRQHIAYIYGVTNDESRDGKKE